MQQGNPPPPMFLYWSTEVKLKSGLENKIWFRKEWHGYGLLPPQKRLSLYPSQMVCLLLFETKLGKSVGHGAVKNPTHFCKDSGPEVNQGTKVFCLHSKISAFCYIFVNLINSNISISMKNLPIWLLIHAIRSGFRQRLWSGGRK